MAKKAGDRHSKKCLGVLLPYVDKDGDNCLRCSKCGAVRYMDLLTYIFSKPAMDYGKCPICGEVLGKEDLKNMWKWANVTNNDWGHTVLSVLNRKAEGENYLEEYCYSCLHKTEKEELKRVAVR